MRRRWGKKSVVTVAERENIRAEVMMSARAELPAYVFARTESGERVSITTVGAEVIAAGTESEAQAAIAAASSVDAQSRTAIISILDALRAQGLVSS